MTNSTCSKYQDTVAMYPILNLNYVYTS
uniref:Uncharacterized protein n=1 Tax=Lepeophtheirus salmonis TaxID=72036 RepID=A0A0K2VIH6_LEPSM